MPQQPADPGGRAPRSKMPQRRLLFLAAVALLAVVAVVVIILAARANDSGTTDGTAQPGDLTEITSPYDFSELPIAEDPPDVRDATYVSILLVGESGEMVSYGANSDLSAAQAICDAVKAAEEIMPTASPSASVTTQSTTGEAAGTVSTLTFVFADRTTLTYELDLDQGLISRGGRTWRPEGDLEKLVQALAAVGKPETPASP